MKAEIKKKWLRALTSGKYRQTKGKLKSVEGRYCCLGVLCDLHRKETKGVWEHHYDDDVYYLNADVLLPEEVRAWAGLKTGNGEFIDNTTGDITSLVSVNDSGKRFSTIAKLIKEYF